MGEGGNLGWSGGGGQGAAEAATRLVSAKAEYLRTVIGYRWAIGTVAEWSS